MSSTKQGTSELFLIDFFFQQLIKEINILKAFVNVSIWFSDEFGKVLWLRNSL